MSSPGKPGHTDLPRLEAEATYARERYQLYKAKAYGLRPTSASRLRELERASQRADRRLRRAQIGGTGSTKSS